MGIVSPKALKADPLQTKKKKSKKREREKRTKKKKKKRRKKDKVYDDDDDDENVREYAQLDFAEKGWKKHQRIATEASIASTTLKANMPMSPSIASSLKPYS